MNNTAIIDLGSNSVRMSIVDRDSGKTVLQTKRAIKLSEGMNSDMILRTEPIRRCAIALLEFSDIMRKAGVTSVFAVATAAVRKAKNQAEFLEQIKRETGIEIRVIDGKTESELDFLGVMSKTDIKDAVILDTGGGSMEIIGARDGKMIDCESIQIGSRSIKELFFEGGETEESRDRAKREVKRIMDGIKWLDEFSGVPVIGIGGCNRTVARICMEGGGKVGYIESYEADRKKVFEIFDLIGKCEVSERGNIKGITPDRTDIIYGGLLPLIVLMEKLSSGSLVVTDAGLRDGIAEKICKKC